MSSDNSIASIDDSRYYDISMYDFLVLPVSHDLTRDLATSLVFDTVEITDLDLKTSHRMKNKHWYLDQYYCGVASTLCSIFSTPYSMHLFVSYDNCFSNHTALCHNISV